MTARATSALDAVWTSMVFAPASNVTPVPPAVAVVPDAHEACADCGAVAVLNRCRLCADCAARDAAADKLCVSRMRAAMRGPRTKRVATVRRETQLGADPVRRLRGLGLTTANDTSKEASHG